MSDNLTSLQDTANKLTSSVSELTVAANRIRRRTRRSEIAIVLTVVSLVADLVVTTILLIGLNTQRNITNQIQDVQASSTHVRHDVLCPLYSLLLGLESPLARAKFVQGPAAYDKDFATLRAGYNSLGC